MEMHEFLQWALNLSFVGVFAWYWRESKKPKLLSQTRLPSLHDEKAKALIGNLEKLEAETSVKLRSVSEQLTGEMSASKKQIDIDAALQKQKWEFEMEAMKKQLHKELDEAKKRWQAEMLESRIEFEQLLNQMKTALAETQKLLQNMKSSEFSDSPSLEEKEIKEAIKAFEENQIPTVRELEDARSRLKRSSSLDLKSVLKEQLS